MKKIELFNEIKKLTYQEFIDFQNYLPSLPIFIDIIFLGSISLKKSKIILGEILLKIDHKYLSRDMFSRQKYTKIPLGSVIYFHPSFEESDQQMTIMNVYQIGQVSFEESVEISFLNYLLDPLIFEQLRDVQQLGYDVCSYVAFDIDVPCIIINVVSDVTKKSNEFIDERIEEVIKKFIEKLKSLKIDELQKKIKAYIKNVTQVDANLCEMASRLFYEILYEKFIFNRRIKKAEAAEKITKDSLIKLAETYLLNSSEMRRKLSIQIIGRNGKKTADDIVKKPENFTQIITKTDELTEEY